MFNWLRHRSRWGSGLVQQRRRRNPRSNYRPAIERLEVRATPALLTWTGAAGLAWSDPDNWNPDQRPGIGDDLVFPNEALNKTNFNDLGNGKNFGSISFLGSGYTLTGNRIELNKTGVVINNLSGLNYINLPINFDFGVDLFPRNYEVRVGTNATLVVNGVISGGLTEIFVKRGAGELILNAANTHNMITDIQEGTLTIQNGAALGSIENNHNTFVRGVGTTLVVQNNITVAEDITVANESNGIRSGSGNNTITGTIFLEPEEQGFPASKFIVNTGSRLTLTDLQDRVGAGLEGGFNKRGGGELLLPTANTNSEDSVIQAGQVTIQHDQALGNTEGRTTVLGGATLAVSGTRIIAEELELSDENSPAGSAAELLALHGSKVTWNGFVNPSGNSRFRVNGDAELKITQAVTFTDEVTIRGSGPRAERGLVEFVGGVDLPLASVVDLAIGGAATLNLSGGLRGRGLLNIKADSQLGGGTILMGGPGAYTHTGFIQLNSAVLEANAPVASSFVVNGGTLRGAGSVANINAVAGTVDPGSGRGNRLQVDNDLTFSSAAKFHVDVIANGADQLRVVGAVNLQNAVLDVTDQSFATPVGDAFVIIDNLGTDPVVGTFAGLGEGDTFTVNSSIGLETFSITYQGFSGNDVVITRVNTATMATGIAITPTIQEGQLAHLTGHLVDPDQGDRLTLVVDWGDGSKPQTFHPGTKDFDITHRYRDNVNGTAQYIVHTSWFDNHGAGNRRDLTVTVTNVAPVLSDLKAHFAGNGQVLVTGRIVDPGQDTFTLVINWGDGESSTYRFAKGTEHFQVHHRYEDSGRYQVTLSVADDDGDSDKTSMILHLASRGHRHDAWWIAFSELFGSEDT